MLPTYGVAYSVMLLASVAELAPRRSADDWIKAAMLHGSHLAAATNLVKPVGELLDCNLARIGDVVEISPELADVLAGPQVSALRDIAQLLLVASPPTWLPIAVNGQIVDWDLIPDGDRSALLWLEPDLDEMLRLAWHRLCAPTAAEHAKQLGDAGELFVLASLRHAGLRAVHVAKFSDAYGYDIEVRLPHGRTRIEVKAAGPQTGGEFHLSRNEFQKCLRYQSEWQLVQVMFTSSAFIARQLDSSHIAYINEIEAPSVSSLVPSDTKHFRWQESARLQPPNEYWHPWPVPLDPSFTMRGFS